MGCLSSEKSLEIAGMFHSDFAGSPPASRPVSNHATMMAACCWLLSETVVTMSAVATLADLRMHVTALGQRLDAERAAELEEDSENDDAYHTKVLSCVEVAIDRMNAEHVARIGGLFGKMGAQLAEAEARCAVATWVIKTHRRAFLDGIDITFC